MNALALAQPNQIAGGAAAPSRGIDVRAVMDHYLAPMRSIRADGGKALELAEHYDFVDKEFAPLFDDCRHPHRQRARAVAVLGKLPAAEWTGDAHAHVRGTLDARADEQEVSFFLGMMLEALRAKETEGAATFFGSIVYTIMDHDDPISGIVLAAAVREIWRRERFAPSPSEFLDECRSQRLRLALLDRALGRVDQLRGKLEKLIAEIGDPSQHPPRPLAALMRNAPRTALERAGCTS